MDIKELIQRDIDDIAQWGHCNFAETFKTLILAKEEIEKHVSLPQPLKKKILTK